MNKLDTPEVLSIWIASYSVWIMPHIWGNRAIHTSCINAENVEQWTENM